MSNQIAVDTTTRQANTTEIQSLSSPSSIIQNPPTAESNEQTTPDLTDTGIGPGRIRPYAQQSPTSPEWQAHLKHWFILSSAGKPIYSRYGDENALSDVMGVVQVLISMFVDGDDVVRSLRCFVPNTTTKAKTDLTANTDLTAKAKTGHNKQGKTDLTVVLLIRGPLYFLVASQTNEPAQSLHNQLQWLYNQIISITTTTQLTRIFEKHRNFDLRRLLGGTEAFLDHLCDSLGREARYILSAIQCVPMQPSLRSSIGASLQLLKPHAAPSKLLYGMLIVRDRLISILRPRNHSFHPSDLHLIINMLSSSTSFKSSPESWLPICLPRYNPEVFLHAYVSYITPSYPGIASDVCLVLVCLEREGFFEMAKCREVVVEGLTKSGGLFLLQQAVRAGVGGSAFVSGTTVASANNANTNNINAGSGATSASVIGPGIPGIRHYMFKSKQNVQFTMPELPPSLDGDEARIWRIYQLARIKLLSSDATKSSSSSSSSSTANNSASSSYYMTTATESIYAYATGIFEVYVLFGPLVTKQNAIAAANGLVRWIRSREQEEFILNAPTF